jgi:hypothetical protein
MSYNPHRAVIVVIVRFAIWEKQQKSKGVLGLVCDFCFVIFSKSHILPCSNRDSEINSE